MRLFGRLRRGGRGGAAGGGLSRTAVSDDRRHLEAFAESHTGVEAFVEPRTTVTETTVVLVANTGEWTRRRVPSPQVAHTWANALGIPSYDAAVVGYPQRMRDWSAQRAAEQKRGHDSPPPRA
ncbi:MAG: hypothetical protein ACXV2H_14845 [Actinomycetes bacterium]